MAGTASETTAASRSSPSWAQLVLGIALVALGVTLMMNARMTTRVVPLLVAIGLGTAGILRLIAARDAHLRWLEVMASVLLVALAVTILLWRSAGPEAITRFIALGLIASGAASVAGSAWGTLDERLAAAMSGLAAILGGVLVLVWPRLTFLLVGAVFGTWLVFLGLSQAWSAIHRTGLTRSDPDADHRRPRSLGAAVSLLLALCLFAASAYVRAGAAAGVPDAFYTPPSDPPGKPGQLIRAEPLVRGAPAGSRAWRILYTTTHADGTPAVASGIVVASASPPPGPRPVISIAHGTTGIVPKCAPSLSETPFANGAGAALERMIANGWVGVMSDYIGLGTPGPHPYLVGEAEARNVLDATRAARAVPGIELDTRTAIWGHSQGGHGALWTGIIAPSYAPELRVIGVAATAPASDLHALATGIKKSAVGKIVTAYIADSWNVVYPNVRVAELVTRGYRPAVERIRDLCFEGRDALAAAASSTQLFEPIFPDDAMQGAFGQLLRANSPTGKVAAPLFIAQGDADKLVLPEMQQQFIARLCAAGQALEYRVYRGRDHMPLVAADSPLTADLVAWTEARLAEKPPKNTC